MTPFKKIYERFEMRIEDFAVDELGVEVWTQMEKEYLMSALGMIELDGLYFYDMSGQLQIDLSDRDEDNDTFNRDLTNREIEVLSLYMAVAWYEPKVNSLEHTLMYYGSKDEKWTSQKDHLKMLEDRQKKYRMQARGYYAHNAGRNNPYLSGEI